MSLKSLQIAPGLELNWTDVDKDLWLEVSVVSSMNPPRFGWTGSTPIQEISINPNMQAAFKQWAKQFIEANADKVKG